MSDQAGKAERFAALHESGTFVMPNPWDAGSAKVLESLGFEALATTSSGFAHTLGREDGEVTLDEVTAHVAALDAATPLPLSVDLENGYGPAPADAAAASSARPAPAPWADRSRTGTGAGIYEPEHAAERVAAAVEAARALSFPFMLTARAENHIRGNPDLDDTIARLRAYEAAGADVLYAPGLRSGEEIRAVCESVSRPVNVLALPDLTLEEIAAAGARRVSVGGALAWVAVAGLNAAARRIAEGDLTALRRELS